MGQGYVSGVGINNSGGSNAFGLTPGQEPNQFGDGTTNRSDVIDLVDAQGASDQAWLDSYDTNTKTYIVIDYKDDQDNRFTEALVRHYGEWARVAIPTTVDLSHESITELKDVSDFASKIGYALVASSSTATNWGGVPVFLKPQADADTLTVAELLTIVSAPTAAATFTESDYSTFVTTDAGEVLKIDLKAIQSEIESVESSVATNATNIQANADDIAKRLALTTDNANWDADSKKLTSLANATDAQDAVTKSQLDAAVGNVSDFVTYKSFSDFETALTARGGSLTFKNLGDEGLSDDEIRGYNMAELFLNMLNREQIFWNTSTDYSNIFPVQYTKVFIERLTNNRCSATLSTKNGTNFYDFAQESTSSAGLWKKRVHKETDGNVVLSSTKLLFNDKTDPTVSGAAGLYVSSNQAHIFGHNKINLTVGANTIEIGNLVDFAAKNLSNIGNITLTNTIDKQIGSSENTQQFVKLNSDGGLTLASETTANSINIKFGGTLFQSFTNQVINFNNTRGANIADATHLTDAPSYGQVQNYTNAQFNSALNPSDKGEMQLIDSTRTAQNDGYGKNKQITYQGIQAGNNTSLDTDYSLIWAIHTEINSTVCFLHFHEDFIEQYIDGGSASGIESLGISIENSKFSLGKSNQNAPTNGMWSYEGLAIPNVDPNSTTNTQFLDANGNNTDKAGALNATYSSGRANNVDGIMFQRGYVNTATTSATKSTFVADANSPWYIGKVTIGGGTFNVLKKFMVFQKTADNATAIQVIYDGSADELGGKIENNSETINQLDERVTALEDDSVALSVDSNGVFETAFKSRSSVGSFSMADNTTKTFELPMVQDVGGVDVNFVISNVSGNQREYKRVHVFNGGNGYEVVEGLSYGHEFTQLSISYDSNGSNASGNATLSIVGTGSGATLEFTYKTSLSFH